MWFITISISVGHSTRYFGVYNLVAAAINCAWLVVAIDQLLNDTKRQIILQALIDHIILIL